MQLDHDAMHVAFPGMPDHPPRRQACPEGTWDAGQGGEEALVGDICCGCCKDEEKEEVGRAED